MDARATDEAADILWRAWETSARIDDLPVRCRPRTRVEGYAIQAALADRMAQPTAGWKIAATSAAGQAHIGVDGPLAGRLFAGGVLADGAPLALDGALMRVAEAEFAFRMRAPLPPRMAPFSIDEVVDAAGSLHPAIEIPDSRYRDFTRVGAPQLIADHGCAWRFVVGAATSANWRARDLSAQVVTADRGGAPAGTGRGANVLGDPRVALAWIANELRALGAGLADGDVVMTGTCVTPVAVAPGDSLRMDFGDIGAIALTFAS